jgi:HEAT repeat protein
MDKVPATRSAAAEALLFIGPLSEDLPALMKLTKDVNSTTRAAVARGLGALGEKSKEAVPQLLLLLNDVDGDVRTAAAEAAGNLGSAGQPMIEKLNDMAEHDPLAKVAAKKSLEKLGAVRK